MKPKLILCLALVLSGGLFGCSTASRHAASKLDLATYQIEQVQSKKTTPYDGPDWMEWQNYLIFSNSPVRVQLARSATAQSHINYGFDPTSLKLQWLKQNELLLISWTTFRLGNGGYTHDGNVILQLHGGRCREIFRDHIEAIAKGGVFSADYSSLKIAYNGSDRTLKFLRRNTTISSMGVPDIRHHLPFTTTFTNDEGQAAYISEVHTIDVWDYKLAGSKLKFLHGSSAVDVGDEGQPIEEIVNGFHVTRPTLELLNPDIRGKQDATGVVILKQEIKPYAVSSYDGLGGSN